MIGLWAFATRLRSSSKGWLPLSIVAAFVVFYVRVGGDLQVFYRMWFWVLPMLALLLGEAVAVLSVDRSLKKDPRFPREYGFDYIRLPGGQLAPVFRRRDYPGSSSEAR